MKRLFIAGALASTAASGIEPTPFHSDRHHGLAGSGWLLEDGFSAVYFNPAGIGGLWSTYKDTAWVRILSFPIPAISSQTTDRQVYNPSQASQMLKSTDLRQAATLSNWDRQERYRARQSWHYDFGFKRFQISAYNDSQLELDTSLIARHRQVQGVGLGWSHGLDIDRSWDNIRFGMAAHYWQLAQKGILTNTTTLADSEASPLEEVDRFSGGTVATSLIARTAPDTNRITFTFGIRSWHLGSPALQRRGDAVQSPQFAVAAGEDLEASRLVLRNRSAVAAAASLPLGSRAIQLHLFVSNEHTRGDPWQPEDRFSGGAELDLAGLGAMAILRLRAGAGPDINAAGAGLDLGLIAFDVGVQNSPDSPALITASFRTNLGNKSGASGRTGRSTQKIWILERYQPRIFF